MVLAAGFDALVTEDAPRVVAHIEVVVDLHRLRDGRGFAEALRLRAVDRHVALRVVGEREIDRGGEQLEHQPAARPDARRVRLHDHPRLGLAGARRREHSRALHLDDADAADVHGRERVRVAECRRLDSEPAAGVEDRRALRDAHGLAVDRQLHEALRRGHTHDTHGVSTPRFIIADSTAFAAV